MILVDGWHENETPSSPLIQRSPGYARAAQMVLHDCMPPDAEQAIPTPQWALCGVSYEAFLDVVLATNSLLYLTVDTD